MLKRLSDPKICCYFSGDKTNAALLDFSAILPEEVEREVKEAAEISMGTEVSEQDIENITYLCDQVKFDGLVVYDNCRLEFFSA